MNLITKLPPRAYMQRVHRNRGIYNVVKTLKCTSGELMQLNSFINESKKIQLGPIHQRLVGYMDLLT